MTQSRKMMMNRFMPKTSMVIKAYDSNMGAGEDKGVSMRRSYYTDGRQVDPNHRFRKFGTHGTLYLSVNKANEEDISPGIRTVLNESQHNDNDYGKTVQKVSKKSKSRFRRKSKEKIVTA